MAVFYGMIILCLFGSALAQYASHEPCPEVITVSPFDTSRFLGIWWEAERHFHNFEWQSSCNKINYTLGDNDVIKVVNFFVNDLTAESGFVDADIFVPNSARPQEMTVHMPLTHEGTMSNYWIVGTDYDNYVNIWGCTNYPAQNLSMTYAWGLTRSQIPSASVLADIHNVWDEQNIDKSNFWTVNQEGCDEE